MKAVQTTSAGISVLVLADTHLKSSELDRMPAEVWALAGAADLVLHAGDVTHPEVLDALAELAPTCAVLGNNDRNLVDALPADLMVELAGVRVAMLHDSGPAAGRGQRMTRRFPDADVVVFGHSHQPVSDLSAGGALLFNPGSPTQRRRQSVHTVGWLELEAGAVKRADILEVGPLSAGGAAGTAERTACLIEAVATRNSRSASGVDDVPQQTRHEDPRPEGLQQLTSPRSPSTVGDDDRSPVCHEEEPKVRFIGNIVRPVFDPIVHVRNHRSLRRLEAAVLSRLAETQAPKG